MTVKVVDASAVVALLFNETTREKVVRSLRGFSLAAPALIHYEAANACLKKLRASPGEKRALLEAFSLLGALSIALESVELGEVIELAERMKLSLYDASYLWLADVLGAELVTLDETLARADELLRGAR